ncbi:hypothetical protein [Nonomuraea pusilla]|nr:hypothetical protein [Nonomuraea pusilla]
MPCVADGRATPEPLARPATQRDNIDKRIADLTETRDRLDSVITGATTNLLTGRSCRAENVLPVPAQDDQAPG